jgi:hypothetical protein
MANSEADRRRRFARRIAIAGGRGTTDDVDAVVAQAEALPSRMLDFLRRKGARIVACCGAVTDHATHLSGVRPDGWPEGMTWDIVPGTWIDATRHVIIATRDGAGGGRVVPDRASGAHGSFHLVVHETMHGHDRLKRHKISGGEAFGAARSADLAALGPHERLDGVRGLEETYAESAARVFAADPAVAAHWPALHGFWLRLPPSALETAAPTGRPPPPPVAGAIGVAEGAPDGAILLDLVAEGPGGAIGHAAVRVEPAAPLHAQLVERVFGREAGFETAASAGPRFVPRFD